MKYKQKARDLALGKKILGDPRELHRGADYAGDVIGGRWRKWEKQALLCLSLFLPAEEMRSLAEACVRYACNVLRKPWSDFEALLLHPFSDAPTWQMTTLISYIKSGIRGSSWNELEKAIIDRAMPYGAPTLAYLYAKWIHGGPWPQGEDIILNSVSGTMNDFVASQFRGLDNDDDAFCATEYALHVRGGRWPALERQIRAGMCFEEIAVDYTIKVRGIPCPKLEQILLSSHCPAEAVAGYAKAFKGGKWADGQKAILQLTSAEWLLDAVIDYSRIALESRWEEAEHLLQESPSHLLRYADEVVKGKLPDHLHQAMELISFASGDPNIKKYIEKYGR